MAWGIAAGQWKTTLVSPSASWTVRSLGMQNHRMQRLASFDGTDIAYVVEGDGPAVLLLHGFAGDHKVNWVAPGVVVALVHAGHRAIAYDARGHGESGKPHDPAAYAPDAMPRDAQALLDHLGVDEVDIVGYSMGALVATRLVPVEPRTRSVVFGGVGASLVEGRGVTSRRQLAEGLLADEPRSVTNPVARAFRRFADRMGADRFALAAIQQAPRAERPDLTKITVPALVLVGDGDTIAKNPDELAAALPRGTSRIVRGDHLTAMHDAAFSAHIVEFLNLCGRGEVPPAEGPSTDSEGAIDGVRRL